MAILAIMMGVKDPEMEKDSITKLKMMKKYSKSIETKSEWVIRVCQSDHKKQEKRKTIPFFFFGCLWS